MKILFRYFVVIVFLSLTGCGETKVLTKPMACAIRAWSGHMIQMGDVQSFLASRDDLSGSGKAVKVGGIHWPTYWFYSELERKDGELLAVYSDTSYDTFESILDAGRFDQLMETASHRASKGDFYGSRFAEPQCVYVVSFQDGKMSSVSIETLPEYVASALAGDVSAGAVWEHAFQSLSDVRQDEERYGEYIFQYLDDSSYFPELDALVE